MAYARVGLIVENGEMGRMRVTVRVRPGASRTRVGGRWGDGEVLGVAVSARAVSGAATAAVIEAVAQAFDVPKRSVILVSGATARTKVLELTHPPADAVQRLAALLEA